MLPISVLFLASPPSPGLPIAEAPDAVHAGPGFDLSMSAFPSLASTDVDPAEYGKWHGSVGVGATLSDGNTERTTFSATGKAENRREKDRTSLDFLWNYTDEDDSPSQYRTIGIAKYDYFVSKKRYYFGQLSGENDKGATLDLRAIVAAGAGYQFREDETWKISGEAGLAYVDEDYEGAASDAEFLAARLGYKADWKPDDKWTAGQAAEIYPSLEDSKDVTARVDTHTKVTLTEKMFAQLQWLYTWDNTPASGAHHVDNLFLLTLGWSF